MATTLFSIKEGHVESFGGVKVVFDQQPDLPANALRTRPEIKLVEDGQGKTHFEGTIYWLGGTLGDLWREQAAAMQGLLDSRSQQRDH